MLYLKLSQAIPENIFTLLASIQKKIRA